MYIDMFKKWLNSTLISEKELGYKAKRLWFPNSTCSRASGWDKVQSICHQKNWRFKHWPPFGLHRLCYKKQENRGEKIGYPHPIFTMFHSRTFQDWLGFFRIFQVLLLGFVRVRRIGWRWCDGQAWQEHMLMSSCQTHASLASGYFMGEDCLKGT